MLWKYDGDEQTTFLVFLTSQSIEQPNAHSLRMACVVEGVDLVDELMPLTLVEHIDHLDTCNA